MYLHPWRTLDVSMPSLTVCSRLNDFLQVLTVLMVDLLRL